MTKKKKQKNYAGTAQFFGEYLFEDTWILVTDSNGSDIQVTPDDLIEFGIPIDKNAHVMVYYDNQKYWIEKNLHFPQ